MVHSGGQLQRQAARDRPLRRGRRGPALAVAVVAALAVVCGRPPAASAQAAIGFQGGVAVDSAYPEQIFGGVFFQSGDLGRGIRVRTGVDGATGEGLRLGTINLDLVYGYPLGANGWTLVAGGGPTIVVTRIPDTDVRDTAVGFHSLLGFGHDSGFFVEMRLGSGRAQELKLGLGWAIALD